MSNKLKVSKCDRCLAAIRKLGYDMSCSNCPAPTPKKERKIKGWTLKSGLENSQSLKVWLDKCPDERYVEVEISYKLK